MEDLYFIIVKHQTKIPMLDVFFIKTL